MRFVDRTGQTLGIIEKSRGARPAIGEAIAVLPVFDGDKPIFRARVLDIETEFRVDDTGENVGYDLKITVEPING